MTDGSVVAGLDVGHVETKAVVMCRRAILSHYTVATGFDPTAAAAAALKGAFEKAGVPASEATGLGATGIFRDMVGAGLKMTASMPDYAADVRGALFLFGDSRTVIDAGGNILKAARYDQKGTLLDVVQNDKCADGLGIFYAAAARALGVNKHELSQLADRSSHDFSIAIQCALSAQSEAIDLVCQGVALPDVANAILRFLADRVASMCISLSLTRRIVVVGGLARSEALVRRVQDLIGQDVATPESPAYVGAIGAAVAAGGGE